MNFGTFGPGIKTRDGGDLLFWILCLKANDTLMMNRAILLIKTTMTAICVSTPALLIPRILGFAKIQKSFLADELVLSEAERRVFNF